MKKHVITLVIGILLLGLGCGYCTFELLDFNYVNDANPKITVKEDAKEYLIQENKRYQIEVNHGVIKIVIDNTLEDVMKIVTSYPTAYAELNYREYTEHRNKEVLVYNFYKDVSNKDVRNAIRILLDDVSSKQFYNYAKTFTPLVEIHISKANLQFLDIDEDDVWE